MVGEEIYIVADKVIGDRIPNKYPIFFVDADEAHKTMETVSAIWDFLMSHHATRRGIVINIGGGVTLDIGGFAASTYQRGMGYINVPTTLLAMADASFGGKTGVNYRGVKNQIGVIREPIDTIIEPKWLATLSEEQLLSGFGEILKCALLDSESALNAALCALEDGDYARPLERAIQLKKRIVKSDPYETGLRKSLNLGHTVGHALEQMGHYPHGYAVVYGMVAALYLSVVKCGLDQAVLTRLSHTMIRYYGKPVCRCSDYEQLVALMQADKKDIQPGEVCFTLLKHIGEPVIDILVSQAEIMEALDYLFSL